MEKLGNVSSVEEDLIKKIELSLIAQREYSKRIEEGERAGEDVSSLKKGLKHELAEYKKLSELLGDLDNEN